MKTRLLVTLLAGLLVAANPPPDYERSMEQARLGTGVGIVGGLLAVGVVGVQLWRITKAAELPSRAGLPSRPRPLMTTNEPQVRADAHRHGDTVR